MIPPKFLSADTFAEGLASVTEDRKKWGFIGRNGKYVIRPQFQNAYSFSEGLAAVRVGGKWGFVDRQGELAIKPKFDAVLPFKGGIAAVGVGGTDYHLLPFGSKEPEAKGKIGYIDKQGNYVWRPTD